MVYQEKNTRYTNVSSKIIDHEPYSRNEYMQNMTDLSKAQTWIQHHVQPYLSQIKITLHNCGK
ncbi:hypothetical protein MTR_6g065530 [Medicago truncatula]|uniref:Uncharacterized protein n=1 Tax=Medicago truncatula TaxID=3880 RepID=G7KP91_MEDTR|nr:hypothetical protein MTR_6g065530 [Medicago truncatula]